MNLVWLPFLLITALINSCIELEISAPSLPDIASQLGVSDELVSLTITYNLLGFCLAALVYGPLSDSYGRRKIMLLGNAILTLGAIGCVFAPSIDWLLVARFIQGIGAATSAVIVSAIIADVYKTEKATKLYGTMNAVFTILTALAPVLGGLINRAIGWRGNYGVVALICVVALGLLFFYLPETKQQNERLNLKKILFDYKILLLSPLFLCASIIPSLLYGCYLTFVAIAPFLYMQTFGLNILVYTLHQAAILGVFAFTSLFSGKITEWLGVRKSIAVGLILSILGATLMLKATSAFFLTVFMSLFCMGSAILYPIIFSRSIEIFPKMKGTASSVIMSMRYFLCSGLMGFTAYLYDGTPFKLAIVVFITMIIIAVLSKVLGRLMSIIET